MVNRQIPYYSPPREGVGEKGEGIASAACHAFGSQLRRAMTGRGSVPRRRSHCRECHRRGNLVVTSARVAPNHPRGEPFPSALVDEGDSGRLIMVM